MDNPLRESGKPLFFKADAAAGLGFSAPAPRHGQSVRAAVRSLSVMQKEALVAGSAGGAVWRLASDEGAYLAGLDEAPCPLAFFTTGMVCSFMEEILALAQRRGVAVKAITLVQDNYYTMKGSALKGTMTGGARDVQLEARIEAEAGEEELSRLVRDAVAAAPVNGLLCGEHKSYFTLHHNGRLIDNARALALPDALPAPQGLFERAEPAPGDWSGLVRRGGKSPETAETVTREGGSLQEEQDRVLHVRGICTLREDGMKQVEQQLFNPQGSIFYFLCEEGPQYGGQGRAPDAASYLAAGIGFCFMTQLGRYAKILKKELGEYAVLQDLHFSPGSGGAGSGRADPVETHVYLASGEDDEFARRCLDMSEQTCFLHAFCRTGLAVDVRVTTVTGVQ